MAYPTNFLDAQRRHWEDAELLFKHQRWANADQLYGLSAECGLKAVMRRSGMPVESLGIPKQRQHRVHINKLWPEFTTFVHGRIGQRYLHLLPSGEPFDTWSIDDRYAHRRHFRRAGVEAHRRAAREVCVLVGRVRQDGLL